MSGQGRPPAVAFDAAWFRLAADELGVHAEQEYDSHDDGSNVALEVETLLLKLRSNSYPSVWRTAPDVQQVDVWATGDSEGVDGGCVVSVTMVGGVQLFVGHLQDGDLAYDDQGDHTVMPMVDAVAMALARIATDVDVAVARYRTSTDVGVAMRHALERTLPMLVRLGDFIGNGPLDPQRLGSLGERCDLIGDIKRLLGGLS